MMQAPLSCGRANNIAVGVPPPFFSTSHANFAWRHAPSPINLPAVERSQARGRYPTTHASNSNPPLELLFASRTRTGHSIASPPHPWLHNMAASTVCAPPDAPPSDVCPSLFPPPPPFFPFFPPPPPPDVSAGSVWAGTREETAASPCEARSTKCCPPPGVLQNRKPPTPHRRQRVENLVGGKMISSAVLSRILCASDVA